MAFDHHIQPASRFFPEQSAVFDFHRNEDLIGTVVVLIQLHDPHIDFTVFSFHRNSKVIDRQPAAVHRIFKHPVQREFSVFFFTGMYIEDTVSFLIGMCNMQGIRIIQQKEIGKLSRSDDAAVKKIHSSGRSIGCTVDGVFRLHAKTDGFAHDCVDMSLPTQDIREGIIGNETEVFIEMILTDIVDDFFCHHDILQLDKHPVFKTLLQFFQIMDTVVALDAQVKKLRQIQILQHRTVSFQRIGRIPRMDDIDELSYFGIIFLNDLGIVHDLSQTDHVFFLFQFQHVLTCDRSSACLIVFSHDRNIAWNRVVAVIGTLSAGSDHGPDPFFSADVGDLVRFGNDGRQSVSCGIKTESLRSDKRTLDMHVDVDKARNHVLSVSVDLSVGSDPAAAFLIDIQEFPVPNVDIRKMKSPEIAVKDIDVSDYCIGMTEIPLHIVTPLQFHSTRKLCRRQTRKSARQTGKIWIKIEIEKLDERNEPYETSNRKRPRRCRNEKRDQGISGIQGI